MSVVLRRLVILLVLAGAAAASRRLWRREAEPTPPPQWPAFGATAPEPSRPEPVTASAADTAQVAWVEPAGDTCPATAPIKAKTRSGIYHVPGGRFYDRTVPDRCYATEAAAEADGYRRSSS